MSWLSAYGNRRAARLGIRRCSTPYNSDFPRFVGLAADRVRFLDGLRRLQPGPIRRTLSVLSAPVVALPLCCSRKDTVMASQACDSSSSSRSDSPSAPVLAAGELQRRICALLGSLPTQGPAGERRREPRFPFPYLIRLTPVGSDGRTPLKTSIIVAGKHISEHGLGFYHPAPLPYRRMVASLSLGNGSAPLDVIVDLTWCRFTREGWYDGGGRFIEVLAAPATTKA